MKRKALLIGINYIGTSNELYGCINDALHMQAYLIKQGFKKEEIFLMTEAGSAEAIPTKQNIIKGIEWLVKDADILFMHYSGHGGSIRDTSGDEKDGKDETIYPLDGVIVDDDLKKILIDPLSPRCKLTCVFDCCHSGTILDLKYNYKVEVNEKSTKYTIDIDKHYKDTEANIILFSGCRDEGFSADTFAQGKPQGAMTFSFLNALKENITYIKLIENLLSFIKDHGYKQIPQLSSGKFINLEEQFDIL